MKKFKEIILIFVICFSGLNFFNIGISLPNISNNSIPEVNLKTAAPKEGYIIVTTNAIVGNSTNLNDFIALKTRLGLDVHVITEDDFGYAGGQQRALNIRQWLQNNKNLLNIKYVLLIGNPDPDTTLAGDTFGDIPMLTAWGWGEDLGGGVYRYYDNGTLPTDYFYADLSVSTWNGDGDNYYGEFYGDNTSVTLNTDISVGRIPVYNNNYGDLDSVLENTIKYYYVNNGSWKDRVILPMGVLNYFNETGDGRARTDGQDIPFFVNQDILSPLSMDSVVLYEGRGIDPVPNTAFDYDLNLSRASLTSEFNKGCGAVLYVGHGGADLCQTKWWANDNDNDGVPNATAGEMGYENFITSNEVSSNYENDQPAFVCAATCNNGYPESANNLGYTLIKEGAAAATVSASRVSIYTFGTWDPTDEEIALIGYLYMKNLILDGLTAGNALYEAKASISISNTLWKWRNAMIFNLYGDPHMKYRTDPILDLSMNVNVDVGGDPTVTVDIDKKVALDTGNLFVDLSIDIYGVVNTYVNIDVNIGLDKVFGTTNINKIINIHDTVYGNVDIDVYFYKYSVENDVYIYDMITLDSDIFGKVDEDMNIIIWDDVEHDVFATQILVVNGLILGDLNTELDMDIVGSTSSNLILASQMVAIYSLIINDIYSNIYCDIHDELRGNLEVFQNVYTFNTELDTLNTDIDIIFHGDVWGNVKLTKNVNTFGIVLDDINTVSRVNIIGSLFGNLDVNEIINVNNFIFDDIEMDVIIDISNSLLGIITKNVDVTGELWVFNLIRITIHEAHQFFGIWRLHTINMRINAGIWIPTTFVYLSIF